METHLTKEFLEAVLALDERKRSVVRIEEAQIKPAVEGGNSYLGEVFRVNLRVVRGDGTQSEHSVVVKKAPTSPTMKKFVMEKGAFTREIKMYTEVLPVMTKLLRSSKEYMEPLWPECISVQNYDTILLHDLGLEGYRMVDRLNFLDLDNSLFVIQALARFHATSVIAKENYLLDPHDFDRYWFGDRNEFLEQIFCRSLTAMADMIKSNWSQEWSEIANDINVLANTMVPRLGKATELCDSNFNVLNHVDPKTPNLLFKHCSLTGRLIGVRFLDYQCVFYGSFAIDVHFFLSNSVEPEVREKHYSLLLRSYHESLLTTFRRLGQEPERVPSLNEVKEEMERFNFVGVVSGLIMLPLTLVDKDDTVALDGYVSQECGEFNKKTFSSKLLNEVIEKLLRPHLRAGTLKQFL